MQNVVLAKNLLNGKVELLKEIDKTQEKLNHLVREMAVINSRYTEIYSTLSKEEIELLFKKD